MTSATGGFRDRLHLHGGTRGRGQAFDNAYEAPRPVNPSR